MNDEVLDVMMKFLSKPEPLHCWVRLTIDFRNPVERHDDLLCIHSAILRKMAEDGVVHIIETEANCDGWVSVHLYESIEEIERLVALPQYELYTIVGMSLEEMEKEKARNNAIKAEMLKEILYRIPSALDWNWRNMS